jgi:hypothetical protein
LASEPQDISAQFQAGVIIDGSNFSSFFSQCNSKKDLLNASAEEGKPIFPITVDNPDATTIFVLKSENNTPSAAIIKTDQPIGLLSTISGDVFPDIKNGPPEGDFVSAAVGAEAVYIDSVHQKSKEMIEFALSPNAKVTMLKKAGETIRAGDPILAFFESDPIFEGVPTNTFALAYVDSQGIPSSDLSKFATTAEGKVIYCESSQIVPSVNYPLESPRREDLSKREA